MSNANSEQRTATTKNKKKMFENGKRFSVCNAKCEHSKQKDKRKQAKECECDCRRPLFVRSRYVLQFENMNAITFIETKISQSYVFSFLRAYRIIVCCMLNVKQSESMENKGEFLDFFYLLLILNLTTKCFVLYLTTKSYSSIQYSAFTT